MLTSSVILMHERDLILGCENKTTRNADRIIPRGCFVKPEGETKKERTTTPEQVPWEKFYLSICGSFQTGGTLFPL